MTDGWPQRPGIVEGSLCGYIVRFMPKDDGDFAEVQVQGQLLQSSCRAFMPESESFCSCADLRSLGVGLLSLVGWSEAQSK